MKSAERKRKREFWLNFWGARRDYLERLAGIFLKNGGVNL
jgi:hypothetical protein